MTCSIAAAISAAGIPSPSFGQDGPFNLPQDITENQDAVLDATAELHNLLFEPRNLIHRHGGLSHRSSLYIFLEANMVTAQHSLCMQAIADFRIADMVPLDGRVSFGEIAHHTPIFQTFCTLALRHSRSRGTLEQRQNRALREALLPLVHKPPQ